MTNIRKEGIETHYRNYRMIRPSAISWEKVLHYAIYGDEFGKPLKIWQWCMLTKVSKNTMIKWLPLIQDYIKDNVLNESIADAIVKSNITKQKNKGS